MSDRTGKDFLSDIQEATRRVKVYTTGMTYEAFLADTKTQDAVIRNLEIIGEAKTVFDDPLYIDFYDPDHSDDEDRYIIIGESQQRRLLIVSYTERDHKTRLINTREVTPREREDYEEG